MESEYICQQSKYYKDNFNTEEEILYAANAVKEISEYVLENN